MENLMYMMMIEKTIIHTSRYRVRETTLVKLVEFFIFSCYNVTFNSYVHKSIPIGLAMK